ncbi:hypothetical protein CEUSTIGMA_g10366.t1 [Chlamydomonas eustigma]|uniref:Uncharacterized protein n=1 Tax=Chlamydomonas eustigma TaxID=1157962 RepID=A0A250XJ46_9CHLO|nr:hypothetical protein CEUSTIGMA_g10366.t1 [Chlamydomonas eustigma]|eukprot:GAX82939.1 hypothetical protein CEUSTIGMA_g10366.t1 [Chlamydomonas eustigma]
MKSCQQHDMIFRSPFKRCVLCTGTGNDLNTPNNLQSSIVRVACVDGCRSAKLIRKTCQSCGAVYDLHTAVMRSEGSTEWLNMPLDQVGFMRVTARLYMQVALLQQFKVKLRTYLASYESMSREYNHCWAVQGQSIFLRIDDVAGGPNFRPVDFSYQCTNRCALSGNGQDLMRAMELFEIQNVAIAEYDQAAMARKADGSAAGFRPSGFRWGVGEEWPLHSLSNVLCDGDSLRQPFLAPGGGHISLFSLHATPSSCNPRGPPQGGSSHEQDNNIQQLQLTSTDDDDDGAEDDELQAALEEDQRSSLRPNRNRDGMRDIASTFVKAIGKTCGHLSHLHQLHRCSHLCCQKLSRLSCPESACNDGLVSSQLSAGVWILDGGVNVHIHCCEVEGCTEPPITRKSLTCLKHSGSSTRGPPDSSTRGPPDSSTRGPPDSSTRGLPDSSTRGPPDSSTRGPPDSSADCSRKCTYRGLLMLYSACGLPLAYQLQYTPECPASVLQFLDQGCFPAL